MITVLLFLVTWNLYFMELVEADCRSPGLQAVLVRAGNSDLRHLEDELEDSIATVRSHWNISIVGDEFMLDGKPFQIISGSIHYFQVPAEYWRDRLLKLKAAGANAVSTYVEWNTHEPEERLYNFKGIGDIATFIKIAQELKLFVLLRPGPYINAERDMGGLPYWLLSKYPNIKLRTTDKDFIFETKTWYSRLFDELKPHLYGNGGPIILVQVENEYGISSSCDVKYKEQLRNIVRPHVVNKALLYTTDPPDCIQCGSINDTLTTIDFGPWSNAKNNFQTLRNFMKHGPLLNSEFYTGWITHWGGQWARRDIKQFLTALGYILDNKLNVNMYMFIGGTHFEFGSGANTDNGHYDPLITSYDFDAPLNESGDFTHKYWAIRRFIAKYKQEIKKVTPPGPTKKGAYGKVVLNKSVNLLSAAGRSKLGKRYSDVTGPTLPTFERLRQRAGLVLYETTLGAGGGLLEINKPRDRIYVYVDNKYIGIIDRVTKQFNQTIKSKPSSVLSLLVENQGRLCFNNYDATHINDFKGYVWINGHNLGRYWPGRGPQVTLYVPGVWLRRGPNRLQLLELEAPRTDFTITFIDHPIQNGNSSWKMYG